MQRFLVPAVAVGLLAGLAPGADLKSGLEPGKAVPVFSPLNVTGKSGVEEVLVSAIDGHVVAKTHESAKKERAEERKEAKKAEKAAEKKP